MKQIKRRINCARITDIHLRKLHHLKKRHSTRHPPNIEKPLLKHFECIMRQPPVLEVPRIRMRKKLCALSSDIRNIKLMRLKISKKKRSQRYRDFHSGAQRKHAFAR